MIHRIISLDDFTETLAGKILYQDQQYQDVDSRHKLMIQIDVYKRQGHEHPVPARPPVPLPRHGPQLGGKPRLQCGIVHILSLIHI